MQRNQVDNKNVSSPSGHHVKIGKSSQGSPENGSSLDRLDPQVISEHEGKDGNAFVVIASSNRTRYVARNCILGVERLLALEIIKKELRRVTNRWR